MPNPWVAFAFCFLTLEADASRLRSPDTVTGLTISRLVRPSSAAQRGNVQQVGRPAGFMPYRGFGTAAAPEPEPGMEMSARQMRALRAGPMSRRVGIGKRQAFGGAVDADDDGEGPPMGVLRLADFYGTEYIGSIGIGTVRGPDGHDAPETELQVVYDTGSADLWVTSDLCKQSPCTERRRFNHSRSETFMSTEQPVLVETNYVSGTLRGELGNDDVHVGQLVARGQPLALIAAEEGESFMTLPLDGIVGLGFAALGFATPLFDSLVQQGAVHRPEFAFYLHRDPTRGGAVLWGGADPRMHEGPLRWFPVVEEEYWALSLASFRIGNQSTFLFGASARGGTGHAGRTVSRTAQEALLIVDSGTTFFTAWGDMHEALRSVTGLRPCAEVGLLPTLFYELKDVDGASHELAVPPEVYMVRGQFGEMCVPGFMSLSAPSGRPPMMLLGEVFMRWYFTVFRQRGGLDHGSGARVGFALARDGAEVDALLDGEAIR